MLWANRAAPDWAKATRHSTALKTRSGGSNCSNGVIYTVDLRLPCCLEELTCTPSLTQQSYASVIKVWFCASICYSYINSKLLLDQSRKKKRKKKIVPEFYMFAVKANMLGSACESLFEFKRVSNRVLRSQKQIMVVPEMHRVRSRLSLRICQFDYRAAANNYFHNDSINCSVFKMSKYCDVIVTPKWCLQTVQNSKFYLKELELENIWHFC